MAKSCTSASLLFAALRVLSEHDSQMRVSELLSAVSSLFSFTDYDLELFNNGRARWQINLLFASTKAVKAGYLTKSRGVWYLTDEGVAALAQGESALYSSCCAAYKTFVADRVPDDVPDSGDTSVADGLDLESIEAQGADSIRRAILEKNPYEFQELVAALLRGMGYFTPYVAPRGKDGGVDIIAYRDPLGVSSPVIKVQVKQYSSSPISVDVVRSLLGIIGTGEVGIVVTSSSFSSDAYRESRAAGRSVRLIDIAEFISLWISHYNSLSEADKALLPIRPVFFLDPNKF